MREKLEKYDKLITAGLVIIAFVLGIGWWFAGEKSEPVYLSKIDRLMFDKDNKAPKFVLTLPDQLTAKEKNKNEEIAIEAVQQEPVKPEIEEEHIFSLEKLLETVPMLHNLPNRQPTQSLEYIEPLEELTETDTTGKKLPKISETGQKPWIEYGNAVTIQPNFKKIAIVISGLGFDGAAINKISDTFNSEVSMSFTPYTPKPKDVVLKARMSGHETYVDLLLPSRDFLKEDTGPLSLNRNLSQEDIKKRFYDTIGMASPVGGVIIRDGIADTSNADTLTTLLTEIKNRGLLIVDASLDNGIEKLKIDGLARRKADLIINKDMTKDEIEIKLKQAENLAFDKGQVLIVTDAKPVALIALYNWIQTFSPQVSYEEAKNIAISKPFALVPVSNLVVE